MALVKTGVQFLSRSREIRLAHRYLEVFKGIVVLVGAVDTVEKPVHRHPYNDPLVEDEVQTPRFGCGQLVQSESTYIVVIPPINRVIRSLNRVIP